ncbi:hypothetical protein Q7C_997 [Methylophaga frappieri]|uniref:Uncharacterized protein n=1 Tax=Methylophaga frappieri (strain ATCC BAA-2434 / DSM 25690 / JAM7) TaxID=754477 RepID=I1YGW6_METFJ|nr:hypothetical protein [Methylophaga frappieri]AFJ02159.1 hypothetical protein Q7C_997 [Methylophaga frappieri]
MSKTADINTVLIRGACLWILMALLLAWCLVGVYNQVEILQAIFPGKPSRILQAHIDFLLMSALIFGFYAARVNLPWHVRWAMVVGAFTNSSLFLMYAVFPTLDPVTEVYSPNGLWFQLSNIYLYSSLLLTSYGFGKGAVLVLKKSVARKESESNCRRCGRELK